MKLIVKLFASAAEAAHADSYELELSQTEPITVMDVKVALIEQSLPLAAVLDRAWFAVNEEYAQLSQVIQEGDQVAVIPPVSGGQNAEDRTSPVELHHEPLSVDTMYQLLLRKEAGAVVLFSGIVREITGEKETLYLEYQAYEEMALKKMTELKIECETKYPGVQVYIWHRLGHLDPAESSVLIGVSSPHREAAFQAGKYAIDELKRRVPIWKKEFFKNGDVEWPQIDKWSPVNL